MQYKPAIILHSWQLPRGLTWCWQMLKTCLHSVAEVSHILVY